MSTLITGASGGIGLELAHVCAEHGEDLILVARSADKLEQLAEELHRKHQVQAIAIALDLTQDNAVPSLLQKLTQASLQVDTLINNAGFGDKAPLAEASWETLQGMLRLNIETLTRLSHTLLPGMLKQGNGRILNVASTAAFFPGPLMAVYYASKAYVLSFSEALAEEVSNQGVSVTALCPGPTNTHFQERAKMDDTRLFSGGLTQSARAVAEIGYHGMRRGKRVVVSSFSNRLTTLASRLAPRGLTSKLIKRLHQS